MPADCPTQSSPRGAVWLAGATSSGLCAARLNVARLILAALNLDLAVAAAPAGVTHRGLGAASLLGATQFHLLVRRAGLPQATVSLFIHLG